MQETRRMILDILRARHQATVEEIVSELQQRRGTITSVTVRHHLVRLQRDGLITSPELRRRSSPGRPQHVYMLTERAHDQFPNNYQQLVSTLLEQMRKHLPPEGVNVIIEGVAESMAASAFIPPELSISQRMDIAIGYLNQQGYAAWWEHRETEIMLHTSNCPYHQVAADNPHLCEMDMRLVTVLTGVVPRRVGHMLGNSDTCSYLIPVNLANTQYGGAGTETVLS